MTTNVAAVRVPTPNADTAANARTEGRGLQNPERGFTLTLSNFEGPFDLLLTLISRRKLDITEVALAEVTDEFLAYLHALYAEGTERALDEASEFLVTAATLLELKTARLLPQHREPSKRTLHCWRHATCFSPVCCNTAPTAKLPIFLLNAGRKKRSVFPVR